MEWKELWSELHRWVELNKPLAGEGIKEIELKGVSMGNDIIFYQLFEAESSTYTYVIADKKTKEAAIIDPVLETVDRDLKLINELDLRLMYILDTHIHADHITGAGEIRNHTKAKTAVSHKAEVSCVDIPLEDGQELLLGDKKIKVIATPGHTNTCITFAFEGMIFTGDALLIRGCGRTDFQQGSADKLYESVHEKLFKLPEDTLVYPGHDYRGQTSSTIGLEKKFNPRLGEAKSKEEFKNIMSELKLANPKKIHEAVPANLACGKPKESRTIYPQVVDGIPEINCEDVFAHLPQVESKKIRLIDVRRPDEFNNEYGHIHGAELVTLGAELMGFLEKGNRSEEIIFICRSGGRSGTAAAESIKLGYKYTINMVGGMIRWNEKKFPVERN
ncbi:MAG TPA: MBL fold metallo-hydrolase [Pseudobdellovibrionaceae bacterium]|jgi:glyoxylase-like metal-dependent hydrolase (beta-lactamase superfamily II)/rhodanese-related sulfurtransferase